MAVETRELAERVERLVGSLDGIRRCRADTGGGEIESIAITAEPSRDRERLVREVRGAVLAYLGVGVSPDRIRIELPEGREESEPGHLRGPEELSLSGGGGFRGGQDEFWRGGGTGVADHVDEEREMARHEADAPPRPTGRSGEIELEEYRIVGGRGPGVEVQVSLVDRNGRAYDGSVSARNLATVQSETFVHATARAARRLMEAIADGEDRPPGTVLEVVGQHDGVRVGEDRFFAVTLEARNGGGRSRVTGFEAVGGKVGADVAIAATLDALRRLLREQ